MYTECIICGETWRKSEWPPIPHGVEYCYITEYCENVGCPGFRVVWNDKTWPTRLLKEFTFYDHQTEYASLRVCEVCEDTLLGGGYTTEPTDLFS